MIPQFIFHLQKSKWSKSYCWSLLWATSNTSLENNWCVPLNTSKIKWVLFLHHSDPEFSLVTMNRVAFLIRLHALNIYCISNSLQMSNTILCLRSWEILYVTAGSTWCILPCCNFINVRCGQKQSITVVFGWSCTIFTFQDW